MAALALQHPLLFALLFILGAVELGLTANNVHRYSEFGRYPDDEFKHRLRFLLFASVWTVFLGIGHALVNLAVGGFLTFLTFVFWLVGAILWERKIDNLDCDGTSFTSICRQIQAIRGIAWTLFGLSLLALLGIIFHVHGNRRNRENVTWRNGFYSRY